MKRIHTLRGPASGHLCTPTIASETNYPKPGLWTANLFFWTTGAMKDRQRCNHHRRIVGCVLSGARRVHPVIVGWSTPQITNIKADHVTLVLEHASPRTKIQLLQYHNPEALPDDHIRDLHKIGMNHVCFAVDDIEAEVAKLRAGGFKTRNEIMDFHSRKLVFLDGPEGVTVELSQWH